MEVLVHDDGPSDTGNIKSGSYICFSVTDTGEGMMSGVLALVTQLFFGTKEQGRATALASARRLSSWNSPEVVCTSRVRQSKAPLSVRDPRWSGTFPSLLCCRVKPHIRRAQLARLLIVDDNLIARGTTAEGVENKSFTVLSATDGAAALAMPDGRGGKRDHLPLVHARDGWSGRDPRSPATQARATCHSAGQARQQRSGKRFPWCAKRLFFTVA